MQRLFQILQLLLQRFRFLAALLPLLLQPGLFGQRLLAQLLLLKLGLLAQLLLLKLSLLALGQTLAQQQFVLLQGLVALVAQLLALALKFSQLLAA